MILLQFISPYLTLPYLSIRHRSHRSIRYTVFAIRYTFYSPSQTIFRYFRATSLECRLWGRAKRIAYSEYRTAYTSMWTRHKRRNKCYLIASPTTSSHFTYFTFIERGQTDSSRLNSSHLIAVQLILSYLAIPRLSSINLTSPHSTLSYFISSQLILYNHCLI